MNDLTACVRAKLDEVKHGPSCRGGQSAGFSYPHLAAYVLPCDCDHPQRVANLVRRMIARFADARNEDALMHQAWEAALAVPSEEERP